MEKLNGENKWRKRIKKKKEKTSGLENEKFIVIIINKIQKKIKILLINNKRCSLVSLSSPLPPSIHLPFFSPRDVFAKFLFIRLKVSRTGTGRLKKPIVRPRLPIPPLRLRCRQAGEAGRTYFPPANPLYLCCLGIYSLATRHSENQNVKTQALMLLQTHYISAVFGRFKSCNQAQRESKC